jgi:hypothetical protein
MNNLMYRGASQLAKTPKTNRKGVSKTYRGSFYTKLPKQTRSTGLHTYRGVDFNV